MQPLFAYLPRQIFPLTRFSRRYAACFFALLAAVSMPVTLAAGSPAPKTHMAGQTSPPGAADPQFYVQQVRPILQANCFRCHAGLNHRGGLSMATQAAMMHGGRDGAVIVPDHSDQSLLIKLIRHEGGADNPMPMPPRGKLSDAAIATVAKWIDAGALMPPDPPAP